MRLSVLTLCVALAAPALAARVSLHSTALLDEPEKPLQEEPREAAVAKHDNGAAADDELKEAEEIAKMEKEAEVGGKIAETAKELADVKRKSKLIKAASASDAAQLQTVSAKLQKKLTETAAHLNEMQAVEKQLGGTLGKVRDAFFAEHKDSTVDPSDIPRAVLNAEQEASEKRHQESAGDAAAAPLECPYTCDPSFCSQKPEADTHCYKINFRKEGDDERLCQPFVDFKAFQCPPEFERCAMSVPDRGLSYHLYASDEQHPLDQPLLIPGHNMHRCLRVYVVPQNDSCEIEDVATALKDSADVMGLSGSPAHPTIEQRQDGKQLAVFKKINMFKEGEFNLCLLQFREDPKHDIKYQILGSARIGTVNATRDESVLEAAAKAEKEHPEKEEPLVDDSNSSSK